MNRRERPLAERVPRWLRITLVALLVVFVVFAGLPVLMGGTAMACETCPAQSLTAGSVCVAVLATTMVLLFVAGPLWTLRTRRRETLRMPYAAGLERPPQLI